MLKLVGLRFGIGLIALLAIAGGVVYTMKDRSFPLFSQTQDEQDWRYQRMLFMKEAYDRLDREVGRQPNAPGAASSRAQQQEIVRQMAEIAEPLAEQRIPPTIRPLLKEYKQSQAATAVAQTPAPAAAAPIAPTAPPPAAVSPARVATAPAKPPDLRPGSALRDKPGLDLSGLSVEPALNAPLVRPRAAPAAKPEKSDKAAKNDAGAASAEKADKAAKNGAANPESPRREP